MKFEKLSKDKIKITLNIDDLNKNDIDFYSFMSNSDVTQSFFLDVLEKAEKDYGFNTKDYKLKIETLAMENGIFVLTITRVLDSISSHIDVPNKKRFKVRRKLSKKDTCVIYKFASFDDFCSFSKKVSSKKEYSIKNICNNTMLYSYNDAYYFILENLNSEFKFFKNVFAFIAEFATFIDHSSSFKAKLHENGKIIIKTKAIETANKYF